MATAKRFSTLVKQGDKLVHATEQEAILYEQFKKNLPEGAVVHMYVEVIEQKKGSLSQKAMLHKMIRDIASHTGATFEDIKNEVKSRTGLCIDNHCESFGDISTDDLNLAIQTTISIGDRIGCPVY